MQLQSTVVYYSQTKSCDQVAIAKQFVYATGGPLDKIAITTEKNLLGCKTLICRMASLSVMASLSGLHTLRKSIR